VWLLEQGCAVDLVDPVARHVDQATQKFAEHGLPGSARVGDARSLAFEDESYDAILLLGPLYHLTDRKDRIHALTEASRVLRPGGWLFIAAISRFASLLDGFSRQLIRDEEFVGIMLRDLQDGQHRNPGGHPDYFTTAFFHSPSELLQEVAEANLELDGLLGVEGPFWALANFDDLWNDPAARELMVQTLRQIEREPSLLGASAHWLAVARRPEQ
jgi:SAM-dependent methyltransferase